MKKLILMIVLMLGVMSCKKENITVQNNYTVNNYVSAIPMYSVIIHNDTLTCDANENIYEYKKISNTEYVGTRIYWKSTQQWTNWTNNVISYYSNNTLYINF